MIAAPQKTDTARISDLLADVGKIHDMLSSSDSIEHKYRIDERHAYDLISTEAKRLQVAQENKKEPLYAAIEHRLRVLCERYFRDFSRHVKG